ncbi:MAG: hypothetical protein WCW40_11840 [Bacteroidota bacterium]
MEFFRFKKHFTVRGLLIKLIALTIIVASVHLQSQNKRKPSPKLSKALIGAWILSSAENNSSNPSGVRSRLHVYTGKHWIVSQADPITGEVVFHHGGTYTLHGDELVKTVEYANASTLDLVKQIHKFKIKIARDTLYQTGIENPWNEVWVRAK